MNPSEIEGAGAAAFAVLFIWLVVSACVYVWYSLALSKIFVKLGGRAWKGWVPIVSEIEILVRSGRPGWMVIYYIIPGLFFYGIFVVRIRALHSINRQLGRGAGMTWLAVLLSPIWASVLAWGASKAPSAGYDQRVSSMVKPAKVPKQKASQQAPAYPIGAQGYAVSGGTPFAPAVSAGYQDAGYPAQGYQPAGYENQQPQDYSQFQAAQPGAEAYPVQQGYPEYEPQPGYAMQPGDQAAQYGQQAQPTDQWAYGYPYPQEQPNQYPQQDQFGQADPYAQPVQYGQPEQPQHQFSADQASDVAGVEHIEDLFADSVSAARLEPSPWMDSSAPAPQVEQEVEQYVEEPFTGEPAIAEPSVSAHPVAEQIVAESVVPEVAAAEPDAPAPAPVAPRATVIPPTPVTNPWAPRVSESAPSAPATKEEAAAKVEVVAEPEELDKTIVVDRRPKVEWTLLLDGGQSFPLTADKVVLGRKPPVGEKDAQYLSIPDSTRTLSKTHARLELADGEWKVIDLNSTNGVVVLAADGSETLLDAGSSGAVHDRFILGKVGMRVNFEGAAAS